jgi:hypothetical protein
MHRKVLGIVTTNPPIMNALLALLLFVPLLFLGTTTTTTTAPTAAPQARLEPPSATSGAASRAAPVPVLDVLGLTAVPDGHYLLNFQQGGRERLINLTVESGRARAGAASDPRLRGLAGEFQLIGNGVFLIALANEHHRATQFWVFRPDGTAAVKEIPDRGERQEAVRVEAGVLVRPRPR